MTTDSVNSDLCVYGLVRDNSTVTCRPPCNETSTFNQSSYSCQLCPEGTYLNPSTDLCQACPLYCPTCYFNYTRRQVACRACDSGNFLDPTSNLCRPYCNSTSTFNFALQMCVNCGPLQYLDNATQTCKACPVNCTGC